MPNNITWPIKDLARLSTTMETTEPPSWLRVIGSRLEEQAQIVEAPFEALINACN